jgi:RimJ/RimL family protein N-acetyltransferase
LFERRSWSRTPKGVETAHAAARLDIMRELAREVTMDLRPVVLEGDLVRLEPLAAGHVPGLWAAAQHPDIWRWLPFRVGSETDVSQLVAFSNAAAARGAMLAFAQILRASDEVMGSTSYLAVEPAQRRLEIGATWLHPRHQRTGANTEAKLLLLRHAFDALGCERVEFKTDAENKASRAALARIGASEEGTLRSHMARFDGTRRDSVYFSVIKPEWPRVRARLEALLARSRSGLPR